MQGKVIERWPELVVENCPGSQSIHLGNCELAISEGGYLNHDVPKTIVVSSPEKYRLSF